MQEPVRDVYRGFEILLMLRHIEEGSIETTLFINPTRSVPRELAQAARQLKHSKVHPLDAAAPITDQIEAAHRIVDDLIEHQVNRKAEITTWL